MWWRFAVMCTMLKKSCLCETRIPVIVVVCRTTRPRANVWRGIVDISIYVFVRRDCSCSNSFHTCQLRFHLMSSSTGKNPSKYLKLFSKRWYCFCNIMSKWCSAFYVHVSTAIQTMTLSKKWTCLKQETLNSWCTIGSKWSKLCKLNEIQNNNICISSVFC
mgnify:CR=1 FL=1